MFPQKKDDNLIRANDELAKYIFGKVQPQAVPVEEAILGAIMLDKDAITVVRDILNQDSFYSDMHGLIYKACVELFDKREPIDLLTVNEQLKKNGDLDVIGGSYYLVELTNRVASTANLESHSRIVLQKYISRQMIKICHEILSRCYEESDDVFSIYSSFENMMIQLMSQNHRPSSSANELADELFANIISIMNSSDDVLAMPTGFQHWDERFGGLNYGNLDVLAARPSMGKTRVALNLVMPLAFQKGIPGIFFSGETERVKLMKSILAIFGKITANKIKHGDFSESELLYVQKVVEKIKEKKEAFFIDDTPQPTLSHIRTEIIRRVKTHGVKWVVIDYLQRIELDDSVAKFYDPRQKVNKITAELKALARTLNINILVLSQLSRAVESRGGSKRPILADLKETGNIEEDADTVTFLFRPAYYNIKEDEQGNSLENMLELICRKNRDGNVGTDLYWFDFDTLKISCFDRNSRNIIPNKFEPALNFDGSVNADSKNKDADDDELPF